MPSALKIFAGQPKLWQNESAGNDLGVVYAVLPESFAVFRYVSHRLCSRLVRHFVDAGPPRSEPVQIKPPLLRMTDPPAPDASAADLELRGDQLRTEKLYLDALDYYRVALAKQPDSAPLLNKFGITELMLQRYREATKALEKASKADHQFADA